ncbi:MAG: helix-turn-helix domain-containing protein [Acidimicrobiales bacterium]
MSTRTLQNQFARELQQTPTNFIRNRRLERARTDLADASPTTGISVTDIATRWGFTHLGRFAVTYKSRFGESPSQTLKS